MSDEQATQATDEAAKAPKKVTEYTEVTMKDGAVVKFAGNRQADKTITVEGDEVTLRINFRSGDFVTLKSSEMPAATQTLAKAHGMSQKVGDEYSGEKKAEDMVLAAESMVERLKQGDWSAPRQAGDSFSGASVVIRAIAEVTGKSVEAVKTFLAGKLEAAKAAGEKLSRSELYASFKNPASKTGAVIERMEREERAKSSKVNADDYLAELG